MATAKSYTFPVGVRWLGRRLTKVSVPGKHDLRVATPPEFRGGLEGVWSPEDLLVSAVATCYAVTLAGIADRRGIPLRGLEVDAAGEVGLRDDGRFGFRSVDLGVRIRTEPGHEAAALQAADDAEKGCLVASSLDLPVRAHVEIDRPAAALAS